MSRIAAITLILVCCGMAGAGDDTYTAEIEKWRQDFEADVRSGGWLTLIGRVKLEGTLWRLGSDPRSTIPLPSQAPAQLGVLYRQALQVRFEPASETGATVDDKPVTAAVELSMKPGSGKIRTRGLELHVRLVGGDPYLFIVTQTMQRCRTLRAPLGTRSIQPSESSRVSIRIRRLSSCQSR